MKLLTDLLLKRLHLASFYEILGLKYINAFENARPVYRKWIDWLGFKLALLDTAGASYVVLALPETAERDVRLRARKIDGKEIQVMKIIALENSSARLHDKTLLARLFDIPGLENAVTTALDALALFYCSPDNSASRQLQKFSQIRFQGATTHTALSQSGLQHAQVMFDVTSVQPEALAANFSSLGRDERADAREFFRTIRWWKPDMWEDSGEELVAYTTEERLLFDMSGFKEHATAAPPKRRVNESFRWGALQCTFRDCSKGAAFKSTRQVLCIRISSDWCLQPLHEDCLFGDEFALAYYSPDYLTVHGLGVLTDPASIEKKSAADMCYMLNSSISAYNCTVIFDFKMLRELGTGDAMVEFLGAGAAIGSIVSGFQVFRSALFPAGSTGIYEFLQKYRYADTEAKAALCLMVNLLHENSRMQSSMEGTPAPPIESRQCIVCSLSCSIYYGDYSELCFCDMECLRHALNPIIGEQSNFNYLLNNFQ